MSLDVAAGEFTAILGPNGSGKTTLLRVLLGELALTAGPRSVFGSAPGAAKRQIGYLPQRRHFDASIRIRGVDLVRLGLDGARWGLPLRRSGRERVDEVIAMVGAERLRVPSDRAALGRRAAAAADRAGAGQPPEPADPRRAARQPRPAQPDRASRRCSSGSAASRA